eukprot:1140853-Pelagomonas_calceolata.AAC.2
MARDCKPFRPVKAFSPSSGLCSKCVRVCVCDLPRPSAPAAVSVCAHVYIWAQLQGCLLDNLISLNSDTTANGRARKGCPFYQYNPGLPEAPEKQRHLSTHLLLSV